MFAAADITVFLSSSSGGGTSVSLSLTLDDTNAVCSDIASRRKRAIINLDQAILLIVLADSST